MKKNNQLNYYKGNSAYAKMLSKIDKNLYSKYEYYLKPAYSNQNVLDLGCGIGTVINRISNFGVGKIYGIDISQTFLKIAKKGKGIFKVFDGRTIPFKKNMFDIVGCFTVLEHVGNPNELLDEMSRVLKVGGILIIASPNFLRLIGARNTHWHNQGLKRSILNFFEILKKIFLLKFLPSKIGFRFIKPKINMMNFQADDDAVCLTNPIDVEFFMKKIGFKIVYLSGLISYSKAKSINTISCMPIVKYITGGFFIVGEKL